MEADVDDDLVSVDEIHVVDEEEEEQEEENEALTRSMAEVAQRPFGIRYSGHAALVGAAGALAVGAAAVHRHRRARRAARPSKRTASAAAADVKIDMASLAVVDLLDQSRLRQLAPSDTMPATISPSLSSPERDEWPVMENAQEEIDKLWEEARVSKHVGEWEHATLMRASSRATSRHSVGSLEATPEKGWEFAAPRRRSTATCKAVALFTPGDAGSAGPSPQKSPQRDGGSLVSRPPTIPTLVLPSATGPDKNNPAHAAVASAVARLPTPTRK
eukprot:TRINITY_DN9639_c0_g1_i2.p1 TRINITY_DN9639_c0_g1~~TRINITY_DN9639_c0_g1_i2.p1  ORF type:complete len:274 (+),score=62.68 TRINITY_DN9639_c0_g1_i2:286-1107(+)